MPPTNNGYASSLSRFKEHLKFFDKGIFSKDSEKILQNLDVPSRDEIGRRREAERIRHSAEMQVNKFVENAFIKFTLKLTFIYF